MPPSSDPDPVSQVFEGLFKRAWHLFRESKYDEANNLCCELLVEPRLGRLYRADLHVILAHSPDDYVWHAAEAVRLYEMLCTNPNKAPTKRQIKSKEELLASAKAVQANALADEKALVESTGPSEDEREEWIQQQMENLDQIEKDLAQEMESEDFQDTSAHDEEMLEVEGEGDQQADMAVGEIDDEDDDDDDDDDDDALLAPVREDSDGEDIKEMSSKR